MREGGDRNGLDDAAEVEVVSRGQFIIRRKNLLVCHTIDLFKVQFCNLFFNL